MKPKSISTRVSLILAALGVLCLPSRGASAETVLERVNRSGKLTVGAPKSSIPFAYINEKKEWVGFSLDLVREIQGRLEKKLSKRIALELKEVTPKNRFALVENGTIDIECGSTTYTRSRDAIVDFSINFFYTGSQLLVKKGSFISSLDDLAGKRVGATEGTTNAEIIRAKQPQAELVLFPDHTQGFAALQQGRIDAYSTDGIILVGLAAKAPNPADFDVVDFFSSEPYSCVLPEDDSKWRDFVNHTFMELIESDRYFAIYDKWFGEQGVVRYPMPPAVRLYMVLFQVMPE